MRRREFISGVLGSAWATGTRPSFAQTPGRFRVGYLSGGRPGFENYADILVAALAEFGWHVGERLSFEPRWAGGEFSRVPVLARELVALQPDLIVCTGALETKSLQAATQGIPIVFLLVLDPVSQGLVRSIARPDGNVTGVSQGPQILWGKRLTILTELLGRTPRRLIWLGNPQNPGGAADWADAEESSGRVGAEITRVQAENAAEIETVFEQLNKSDALLVPFDYLFSSLARRIAELAQQRQLPAFYGNRAHVVAGGLISYGADVRENYRQGAVYVDRILKGARPSDLPVSQASRFELALNLATAKDLGLTVSPNLLARADEVIE